MAHYNLRIWASGHGPGIALRQSEFEALVEAARRIRVATDIEEKLAIVLANHIEYENELLSLALRMSFDWHLDDARALEETHLVNRRAINHLSACRAYVDQTKHCESELFSRVQGPSLAELFSQEYNQHLEYRVAEALRNHSQHRAFPVTQITWPSAWQEKDTPSQRLRFQLLAQVRIEDLVKEGGFKRPVLNELLNTEDEAFSLTLVLRKYVECLGRVHSKIRDHIGHRLAEDEKLLASWMEHARAELYGGAAGKLHGLAITRGDDPEKPTEKHFISNRSLDRWHLLSSRNKTFAKSSLRYASAEHPGRLTQPPRTTSD